ncbi:hypothetical protein [Desulfovibrio inopinatus]|uniref:hypothetical protein n=1 Tax=Desulfovibrio inopinatus TaxID=102109 RepID=UPI0004285985|nr:hypothetical protein [Desulfovibrio inopinatus]
MYGKKIWIPSGILLIGVIIFLCIQIFMGFQIEKQMNYLFGKMANYVDINYETASYSLLSSKMTFKNLEIRYLKNNSTLYVKNLVIYDIDTTSDFPSHMDMHLAGLRLNNSKPGSIAAQIQELGYSHPIKLYIDLSYTYNKKEKDLVIERLSLGADDIGALSYSLHLGNVDMGNDSHNALKEYNHFLVYSSVLSYRDDSAFNKYVEYQAIAKGISEEKVRDDIFNLIDTSKEGSIFFNMSDEVRSEALAQVRKFINNPATISLSITPKKPISVEDWLRIKKSSQEEVRFDINVY